MSRAPAGLPSAVALLVLASCSLPLPETGRPAGFPDPIRGVTISTHYDGQDWARIEPLIRTLQDMRPLGVEWVAIHPYAWIGDDGEVRFRELDPRNPPAHIAGPIAAAHREGFKILIKPHLGYWGSRFGWRGAIEFDDPEQWERFWSGYERWIVSLAAVCADADGFVVGTELDRTFEFEQRWRALIDAVRRQTTAPLTYAANWSEYSRAPFWDALDAIGIQAYFPLAEHPGAPEESLLREAWQAQMAELRAFGALHDRPLLFTELGYNRSRNAAVRPWDSQDEGEQASPIQETCMRVALQAIDDEPAVLGAFLWKWFPYPHPVGSDFPLATPPMKQVIREAWGVADQSITGTSRSSTLPSLR